MNACFGGAKAAWRRHSAEIEWRTSLPGRICWACMV